MNKSESGKDQRMGDVHLPMLEFDIENSGISQRYNLQDLVSLFIPTTRYTILFFKKIVRKHFSVCKSVVFFCSVIRLTAEANGLKRDCLSNSEKR